MQRVFLLPEMKSKTCFFTPRLQAFNETFASLSKDQDICVVWHEGTAGRSVAEFIKKLKSTKWTLRTKNKSAEKSRTYIRDLDVQSIRICQKFNLLGFSISRQLSVSEKHRVNQIKRMSWWKYWYRKLDFEFNWTAGHRTIILTCDEMIYTGCPISNDPTFP